MAANIYRGVTVFHTNSVTFKLHFPFPPFGALVSSKGIFRENAARTTVKPYSLEMFVKNDNEYRDRRC